MLPRTGTPSGQPGDKAADQGAERPRRGPGGNAFLLSQVGSAVAADFGERLRELDLTPAQAGLLRAIMTDPGRSQQALAQQLGMVPSSLVSMIDELERRGILERRRHQTDRRRHAIHLSRTGEELYAKLSAIARAHEQDWMGNLTAHEREQLGATLRALVAARGLTPGVHPGYRDLRRPR
jgi:DNA-binding MarR family transcriptional regulator